MRAGLTEDPLFLACTRPAMFAGVPMEAFGVNLMVTTIAFLIGGSLLYLSCGVAIHLVCQAIVRHDHNAFRVLACAIETRGRHRNRVTWGGQSISPLSVSASPMRALR